MEDFFDLQERLDLEDGEFDSLMVGFLLVISHLAYEADQTLNSKRCPQHQKGISSPVCLGELNQGQTEAVMGKCPYCDQNFGWEEAR